jgi:hypothetical protein
MIDPEELDVGRFRPLRKCSMSRIVSSVAEPVAVGVKIEIASTTMCTCLVKFLGFTFS